MKNAAATIQPPAFGRPNPLLRLPAVTDNAAMPTEPFQFSLRTPPE